MSLFSVFLIALGISVDGLAVSVSSGVCIKCDRFSGTLKLAAIMGFFHFAMPLIGWLAGKEFKPLIEAFDHWVAFLLLAFIGGKMIFEVFFGKEESRGINLNNNMTVLGISLATSIDALIVGISFGLLEMPIIIPVLITGGVMFAVSAIGCWLGNKIGNRFNTGFEIFGGIVLIGLGLKIFLEHTI